MSLKIMSLIYKKKMNKNKIILLIFILSSQILFAVESMSWNGIYSFGEKPNAQNVDMTMVNRQSFKFLNCKNNLCYVEYSAIHKYSTCEINKDDKLLQLKILSSNEAILYLTIKDENHIKKSCEVRIQKTPKGFKIANPSQAINECNINLSIFQSCGANTNPDWSAEFIKE